MSYQVRCDSCDAFVPKGGVVFHKGDPYKDFVGGGPGRLDFCHYGCVELWARAQNGN